MTTYWQNGFGGSSGTALASASPINVSGNVYFVSSTTGNDSNSGLGREQAFATLSMGLTAAGDGDVVVLMEGHREDLAGAQAVAENELTIVGEGAFGTDAMPRLRATGNVSILTVSGRNVQIHGVHIGASTATNSSHRVSVTGNGFVMRDCLVECGDYDEYAGSGVRVNGDFNSTFASTEFRSVSTTVVSAYGLSIAGATNGKLTLDAVTFENRGGKNFYDGRGASINNGVAIFATNLRLLNGADLSLGSTIPGYIHIATATGGARVNW